MTPPPQTVILIRHGEKPGHDGPPHGVNRHGEHDEHSLSVRGWTRAGALAAVFAHAPLPVTSALATPTSIIATKPTDSNRSRRERDTALPTALKLGLRIDDSFAHGEEETVAAAVMRLDGTVLVVWHHGRMAGLVRRFPLANPDDVSEAWPDDRFDLFWILVRQTVDPVSYRFVAQPQLLLEGDHGLDGVDGVDGPDGGDAS